MSSNDPTTFYGYASSRLKIKDDLSMLIAPSGAKVFRDSEKAEVLSDLFEKTYLNAPVVRPSSSAVLVPSDVTFVDDFDVSEASVLRAIKETKATWSTSHEGVPAAFLKRIAGGVAKPLSIIYRRSLDEGEVPAIYVQDGSDCPNPQDGYPSRPLEQTTGFYVECLRNSSVRRS